MSSCKCANIFEPIKVKTIKEHHTQNQSLYNDIYLTKEGKMSPNQSSKYFEKSSFNKTDDNGFYLDFKKNAFHDPHPKTNILNEMMIQPKFKDALNQSDKDKIDTQRSIEGQNTPHVQIHEIKKIENNVEIPIMFETYMMSKFNKESFMDLFKCPKNKVNQLEDIAP